MLSIEEIKNVSFRKASIGGYKPEDVDAFIDQVLITMEQLRKEKSDLIKKMDILATRVEEYRADEDSVRNTMLSAQRVADSTIKEARSKAAKILEESENVAKAKLYDLNVQIKQQKKQYTLLLAECSRLREEIIAHCNKHIALVSKELPSDDRISLMQTNIEERFPTDNKDDFELASEVVASNSEQEIPRTDVPVVSEPENVPNDYDDYDVSLVSDITNEDVIIAEKKHKSFDLLKFGDDYDIDSEADSNSTDNT